MGSSRPGPWGLWGTWAVTTIEVRPLVVSWVGVERVADPDDVAPEDPLHQQRNGNADAESYRRLRAPVHDRGKTDDNSYDQRPLPPVQQIHWHLPTASSFPTRSGQEDAVNRNGPARGRTALPWAREKRMNGEELRYVKEPEYLFTHNGRLLSKRQGRRLVLHYRRLLSILKENGSCQHTSMNVIEITPARLRDAIQRGPGHITDLIRGPQPYDRVRQRERAQAALRLACGMALDVRQRNLVLEETANVLRELAEQVEQQRRSNGLDTALAQEAVEIATVRAELQSYRGIQAVGAGNAVPVVAREWDRFGQDTPGVQAVKVGGAVLAVQSLLRLPSWLMRKGRRTEHDNKETWGQRLKRWFKWPVIVGGIWFLWRYLFGGGGGVGDRGGGTGSHSNAPTASLPSPDRPPSGQPTDGQPVASLEQTNPEGAPSAGMSTATLAAAVLAGKALHAVASGHVPSHHAEKQEGPVAAGTVSPVPPQPSGNQQSSLPELVPVPPQPIANETQPPVAANGVPVTALLRPTETHERREDGGPRIYPLVRKLGPHATVPVPPGTDKCFVFTDDPTRPLSRQEIIAGVVQRMKDGTLKLGKGDSIGIFVESGTREFLHSEVRALQGDLRGEHQIESRDVEEYLDKPPVRLAFLSANSNPPCEVVPGGDGSRYVGQKVYALDCDTPPQAVTAAEVLDRLRALKRDGKLHWLEILSQGTTPLAVSEMYKKDLHDQLLKLHVPIIAPGHLGYRSRKVIHLAPSEALLVEGPVQEWKASFDKHVVQGQDEQGNPLQLPNYRDYPHWHLYVQVDPGEAATTRNVALEPIFRFDNDSERKNAHQVLFEEQRVSRVLKCVVKLVWSEEKEKLEHPAVQYLRGLLMQEKNVRVVQPDPADPGNPFKELVFDSSQR